MNDIEFERKDGKFLLRFLRARKFKVDQAAQLYINYYKYKHKFRHLLVNSHPNHVGHVLEAGLFGIIEGCMRNGSRALCMIAQRWNPAAIHPNDPFKTFLMVLEKLADDEEVQVHGVSIVDNLEGVSWHLMYTFFRSELIQKGAFVELQESFPMRFKGFHMLHQPWYLSMIMAFVKPFLSQKHRDRIHAHGSNYNSLREHVDTSVLPENFGGEGVPLEADNLYSFFEVLPEKGQAESISP